MPIYLSSWKDSASSTFHRFQGHGHRSDGIAVVVVKEQRKPAPTRSAFRGGAASSAKITVTDLSLGLILSDKVLQARESDSTFLHILLLDKIITAFQNIKLTEYFQKSDRHRHVAMSVITTNALERPISRLRLTL